MQEHAVFQVSLKVIIRRNDEFLFLREYKGNLFDLPGGRIDDTEHDIPLAEIIAREVREELGEEIKYKLGKPVFQFRRCHKAKRIPVLLTVYEADYLSGEIKLSDEHNSFFWLNPKETKLEEKEFVNKEEYLAFKTYFDSFLAGDKNGA